ncbi:unnamed protein product [Lactuca virosa]|uniref:NB-ARC domain-containing protein n=1 Tax=Lactuca virosa TaxID=75947 RepID=A0AAU9PH33_9ASTR|nr:unnamed protein product [Lactuca virosa]
MTTTDLDVFMENLEQLLYDDSNKLISSNELIKAKKPEIELLYKMLEDLIGSGLNNTNTEEEQLHEAEDMENWKRRLINGLHEAENAIDKFIYSAYLKEIDDVQKSKRFDGLVGKNFISSALLKINKIFTVKGQSNSNFLDCSLNLTHVMKDLKSIRHELSCKIRKIQKGNSVKNNNIQHQHLLESQSATRHVPEASSSKTTARVGQSATESEQVIVGFDEDALLIMERLAGDRKQLDIISIVGMGGLGKTTLATKVYNDEYVEYYFDVRGWVTVSEEYATRDVLIGILASIGKSVHEDTTEGKVCEMVYRSLKGRKYLIVLDDIWSSKAWDDLRLYFPDDNTGSRVLLTTRLAEVASHATTNPGGLTHNLQYLSQDKSWELLRIRTFRGYECPRNLIDTGKRIAAMCKGLPLALVVIAGLLEKAKKNEDLWDRVARNVSSYIIDDPNGCLDTLALSYDHLPRHLKNCFLYVGGFPEDNEIQVQRLIRLWMAEGFIKETAESGFEEQAEDYLTDLVDRNLLIVVNRRSDGGIKSCRLHDLLRELCLIKAAEEKFYYKLGMPDRSSREKQQRLFTDYKLLSEIYSHGSIAPTRSVLCFPSIRALDYVSRRWVPSFLLLRVLDLLNIRMSDFSDIPILIHLRYLAVWLSYCEVSFSEATLLRLQTLIVKGKYQDSLYSPCNMGNMTNLRYLWSERVIALVSHERYPVLFNLHTISRLGLGDGDQTLLQSFPNIKKLGCSVSHTIFNFALLSHLESLNVKPFLDSPYLRVNQFVLPKTLKKLTLMGLHMPWGWISTIQQLPKLEVLKLLDSSFVGNVWDTGDEEFHQLKFLKLQGLDMVMWKVSTFNFPQLRKLEVRSCNNLRGIPLEIGNISTLEHIEISDPNFALLKSVNKIQETQHAMGNYDIHVKFVGINVPHQEVFFEGDPYYP